MAPSTEPRVGAWYDGELHTGTFRVTYYDALSGTIRLKAIDGRLVRMTLERWRRQPLTAAHSFEWHEPVIG
jgi:hypothetical protein